MMVSLSHLVASWLLLAIVVNAVSTTAENGPACNTKLSEKAGKLPMPSCPADLPPGLAATSAVAKQAHATVLVSFDSSEDPWHSLVQPRRWKDAFWLDRRVVLGKDGCFSRGTEAQNKGSNNTNEPYFTGVPCKLLAAFNLGDRSSQNVLASIQYLELFERWVLEARSPEDLEYVLLPKLVTIPGAEVLRNSFITHTSFVPPDTERGAGFYWLVDALKAVSLKDTIGTPSISIAILASGADTQHPDLMNNIWKNPRECDEYGLGNGIDDDGDGVIDDCNGVNFIDHNVNLTDLDGIGTHITGIIGASGTDGPLFEIPLNGSNSLLSRTSLMILKVLDRRMEGAIGAYGTASAALAAWAYAYRHGARIIHNSWEVPGTLIMNSPLERALFKTYMKPLQDLAAVGILSFFGAGNDGVDIGDPGSLKYPAALKVGLKLAIVSSLNGTSSNFGNITDLSFAESVVSTLPRYGDASVPPNVYDGLYAGTAQAAAAATAVAGACLTVIEHCGNEVLPAAAFLYTKEANQAVYNCLTTGRPNITTTANATVNDGSLKNTLFESRTIVQAAFLRCCSLSCKTPHFPSLTRTGDKYFGVVRRSHLTKQNYGPKGGTGIQRASGAERQNVQRGLGQSSLSSSTRRPKFGGRRPTSGSVSLG